MSSTSVDRWSTAATGCCAKDDKAEGFYSYYGLVESPIDPLVLMMPLRDLRRGVLNLVHGEWQ
jgi:hypothetical protein